MKKIIILIVLGALIIFVEFTGKQYNPYAGTYQFAKNSNLVLRLYKDSSYILFNAVGKKTDFVKGEYQVENNAITLTPKKNNIDKFIIYTLHGKVDGSKITIEELKGEFVKQYK